MERNFLLETAILSVVCVNVNNALCDCCIVGKEKKFIADALGIKKDEIWFIEKFKGKNFENELKTLSDKEGEDFEKKASNSHVVILFVVNVDDSGVPKEDGAYFLVALIDKGKTINPSSELLDEVADVKKIFTKNNGKKVKYILVIENKGVSENKKFYSCKKN